MGPSIEDTLVVYIASHGVVGRCAGEARAAYHVVLYGASEENPCADVIDTSALTRELARIPAREKLLLLDTCQAGGSVSPEALRALRGDQRDDALPILSERYVGRSQTPAYGAMGSDFAIAIVHEDDPPLLAVRLDAPGEAAGRGGFELSAESPLGQVQAHVDGYAAATAACSASGPLDVRAAWNVAGDVRFSVVGRGAGTEEASCVERALGTLRVEDHGSREGHVRVAVGGARTGS